MMLEGGKDAESRIAYGFRLVTSRKPARDEAKVLVDVFNQQLAMYRSEKDAGAKLIAVGNFKSDSSLDQAELAAYTTLANMLLNLDETITKN